VIRPSQQQKDSGSTESFLNKLNYDCFRKELVRAFKENRTFLLEQKQKTLLGNRMLEMDILHRQGHHHHHHR